MGVHLSSLYPEAVICLSRTKIKHVFFPLCSSPSLSSSVACLCPLSLPSVVNKSSLCWEHGLGGPELILFLSMSPFLSNVLFLRASSYVCSHYLLTMIRHFLSWTSYSKVLCYLVTFTLPSYHLAMGKHCIASSCRQMTLHSTKRIKAFLPKF